MLKKKYLPEFDDELFRDFIQDALYFREQYLRPDSGHDLANDQADHRHFLNTKILLNLLGYPWFRYLVDNLVGVEFVPVDCGCEYILAGFGKLRVQGLGLVQNVEAHLFTVGAFRSRVVA